VRVKTHAWLAAGALVVAGALFWTSRRDRSDASTAPAAAASSAGAAGASSAGPAPNAPMTPAPSLPSSPAPSDPAAAAPPYPLDLEDLRARIPNNRYWELGVPTKDPEVAKARAERAKRDNALLGRTQTGEATEPEIRAYYADQRRTSEDYLELSLLVLAEKGAQLPERDRGLFELSVQLHRARLKQIERDLTDALARRRARGP
jgi:hypothetical protein